MPNFELLGHSINRLRSLCTVNALDMLSKRVGLSLPTTVVTRLTSLQV